MNHPPRQFHALSARLARFLVSALLMLTLVACERRSAEVVGPQDHTASAQLVPISTLIKEGAQMRLVARHHLGVPLHSGAGEGSVSARLPDRTVVTIRAIDPDTGWVQVEDPQGTRGWITKRYLDTGKPPAGKPRGTKRRERHAKGPTTRDAVLPKDHPAASLKACLAALQQPRRHPTTPRLATMNVRWFPDGKPGKKPRPDGGKTNTAWLACLLAHTGAEAVALQEIKNFPRAQKAMADVIAALNRHTGGQWKIVYDACPQPTAPHGALLWDSKRARATGEAETIAALNPHGEACANYLRPGVGMALTLSDGTAVYLVGAHFKSGPKRRSYDLRRRSGQALGKVAKAHPGTLVVAGDFNTMGCRTCAQPIAKRTERAALAAEAKAAGLRLIEPEPMCSYTWRGEAGILDGLMVADALAEGRQLKAWPASYCDALQCHDGDVYNLDVRRQVSDHCPVVLGW